MIRRNQRRSQRLGAFILATTLLLGGSGCDGGKRTSADAKRPATVLGPEHRFAITVGGRTVQMRLAIDPNELHRGLMNVPSMPEDEGMLFVYAVPQRMSFYMRNCPFPQDIGFFDATGTLREIYPMYPGVEDPVLSAGTNLKFALEMNQGWYAKHGVSPGKNIDLAAVRAAVQDRGYDPTKFFAEP